MRDAESIHREPVYTFAAFLQVQARQPVRRDIEGVVEPNGSAHPLAVVRCLQQAGAGAQRRGLLSARRRRYGQPAHRCAQ